MTKTPSLAGTDAGSAESRMGLQADTEQNPALGGPAKSQQCSSGAAGPGTPSDLLRTSTPLAAVSAHTQPGCSLKKHKVWPATGANLRFPLGDGSLRLLLGDGPDLSA